MPAERLQKILARHGYGSRRRAEELIREGRVTIDGRRATLGERADVERATVAVDGAPLGRPDTARTLLLHKPRGVLVTAADERGRRTVYDLLPDEPPSLRYAGRLDRDSEGALLLSTDGELVHRISHPRYELAKTYEALVEGVPAEQALGRLRAGVELDDGPTAPARAELVRTVEGGAWVRVVIHEGRKRQVRRMLEAVGHPVRRLVRVAIGKIALGDLAPGESRELSAAEARELRTALGLLDAGDAGSLSSPTGPDRPAPPSDEDPAISSESIARSIAIDGPTASGKSVVGRALAETLGLGFLDTGMMYRACTLAVLRGSIAPEDGDAVTALVRGLDLEVEWPEPSTPRVRIAGEDVTGELRGPEIEATVSLISRIPEVRDEMVRRQRAVATGTPIVMAGRDIGTRVLVEARTKVFLEASAETRARRRLGEELDAGRDSTFERVLAETRRRDELDATGHRAIRREQAAPDAIVIDTDALGIDQVVEEALEAYRAANPA